MNSSAKNKKTVIDPVCGMAVGPAMTDIEATVEGITYYFCAEGCRKSFVEDPQKFLDQNRQRKKSWWCRYTERLVKATSGKSIKCH